MQRMHRKQNALTTNNAEKFLNVLDLLRYFLARFPKWIVQMLGAAFERINAETPDLSLEGLVKLSILRADDTTSPDSFIAPCSLEHEKNQ